MKNLLLLLAGTGILLAGCKNDTVLGNKPTGNRYDMISAHPWKLVKLEENSNEVSLTSCRLDDIYVFDFEGSGYMDEGATKCGETAPVDTTITNPEDTTIIVSKATVSNADDIQYDPSGRRINFTWTVVGDQRYVLIYNYGSSENNPEWEILEMDNNHFVVKGTEKRNGTLIVYYKHFQAL